MTVVVIGGGITGLSTAFRLKQRAEQNDFALECTVLEGSHRLGGKILTHRTDDFILETGPDSLLARKPAGIQLIRDLGIESEVVHSNQTAMQTFVLHKNKLVSMPKGTNMGIPASAAPLTRNRLVSPVGRIRALKDLVMPATPPTGDTSVGQFLKQRLGNEWVEMMCEPLLAGIHAGDLDELSLKATYPNFLQLGSENRSLIIASSKQMRAYKPPKKSSGRSAFVTLKYGLQTVVERLYDSLSGFANLQTDSPVERIEQVQDEKYLIHFVDHGTPSTLTADAVVCTVPADAASKLIRPVSQEAANQLAGVEYTSTATVLLAYDTASLPQGVKGSGFLVPRSEGKAITACTFMSSKWPNTAPKGRTMIRCYVGRRGQQEYLQQDDASLIQTVQTEISEILGWNAEPLLARVTRWNKAMPQYLVGHMDRVAKAEQALARDAGGVILAGSAYHGVGIPDCIAQAQRSAEQILNRIQQD
ncbi:protoporphyrinogen oxidase [Alicyclobacillus sp. SO9]|uniref:protoporphyrinogen oxidase n=1 Tax=Alicyclobacillus sp. SO9 TaxID=2665646 RepID=UPI0018E736CB|nr:protoporphyrinogen oxidase [Alicyclobacillus sp. SO9]QQE77434.1 protoporphyrinogen oxidase [Alicyclobacillus sp. SO9]